MQTQDNKIANYIQVNKAALFDWLVFSISLFLGLIFPSIKEFSLSPSFSYWILSAILLYTAGVWLKHLPVRYRIATGKEQPRQIGYLLFLIIGHWTIMMVGIIFSADAFMKILHYPSDGSYYNTPALMITSIFGSAFITWVAYSPGRRYKKQYAAVYLYRRELGGDILLTIGVSILSFIFWDKTIFALFEHMPLHKIGDVILLFFFVGFCYMLFYLPLRYLYLLEDHTNNKTWRRMLLLFALLLVRGLFAALSL